MTSTSTRYGISGDALDSLLREWGEPRYRGAQVSGWLYRRRRPLDECTNLSKSLRARLERALPLALGQKVRLTASDGMTAKWLWAGHDGAQVETVLMRYPERATVCVSSQAGCALGCTFCATGQAGFERHLDTGEIVEQVMRAAQVSPQPVSNVVFMGMGEPLANYDAVWSSIERLHGDAGMSARRLCVSTVGLVPAMRRLASERLPVTLAVSLHAPDDELRDRLVPLNRRYPLAAVLEAAEEFAAARGRRVTFEYACIAGVNDAPEQIDELARLLEGFRGPGGPHVNLIPLNRTAGFAGRPPTGPGVEELGARLRGHGINTTVRRNRGVDIDAACGQLRARVPMPTSTPESATMGR